MPPELLDVREVAAILRVSEDTIYEALQKGRVPGAFRPLPGSRLWRIRKAEFYASLAGTAPASDGGAETVPETAEALGRAGRPRTRRRRATS